LAFARLRTRIGAVDQQLRFARALVEELTPAVSSQQSLFADAAPRLRAPALARVMRDGEKLADVEVTGLKRGPNDVRDDIAEGEMCGMSIATSGRVDLAEGDHIELYTRESVQRSLYY
jgi:hypothetical protein